MEFKAVGLWLAKCLNLPIFGINHLLLDTARSDQSLADILPWIRADGSKHLVQVVGRHAFIRIWIPTNIDIRPNFRCLSYFSNMYISSRTILINCFWAKYLNLGAETRSLGCGKLYFEGLIMEVTVLRQLYLSS